MRNSQRTQRLIANFRALLRDEDVGGLDQTPNVRCEIIALALMAVVGVALIFMFPGSPEQDTDYHFLIARTAWLDHSYFVNVWGRPLFTTTFAPAASIGYTAARFFALAISLTTAWQTCRLAIDFRIARAWVVIPVLIGQPTFFALFTDVYTEPLFALVFVLALRLHFSGRIKLGMFVASLLPLARPEGVFLCLCWGLWVLTQPKTTSLKTSFAGRLINRLASTLILAIGVVCWWLAALIITGDPLFILHNWPWGFHSAFVHGSLFDYARRSAEFAGLLLVYPFIVGLLIRLRSRAWLPIISSVLVLFLLHSVFIAYGLFGEAGYARYMVAVAPAIALLTLVGWNAFASIPIPFPLAGVIGFVVLTLSFLRSALYVDKMPWARDPIAINEMAAWLEQNPQPLSGLIWSQGRMCTVLGLNLKNSPYLKPGREDLITRLRESPSGTIVFWDDHIGPDWFGLTATEIEDRGYKLLRTRRYVLHSVFFPDDRFASVKSLLRYPPPREIELSFLQKL